MMPVTPRGFKDVLPQEALWRESITRQVQGVLSTWGYAPIETPTLEVLEVLELGGQLNQTPLRLFDSDGALLVLRPDVTLPIARLVASRLKDVGEPLRYRYVQPVFREEESLRGQAREFTQIGVEFIGQSGASADAEVILLMVEALKACGLGEFTLAICTVGVLRDLLDLIVNDNLEMQRWRALVLRACHQNNLLEVNRLAADPRVSDIQSAALKGLLGIHGDGSAIKKCKELMEPLGCAAGLDQLAQTFGIIEKAGAGAFVTVDFSVMSAFDYYTGLVFEAYAPGLGVLLGSGGRYDRMLEAYGVKLAAAGFAFNLERVMMALMEQDIPASSSVLQPPCLSIPVDGSDPGAAFIQAARLIKEGNSVVLMHGGTAGSSQGAGDDER